MPPYLSSYGVSEEIEQSIQSELLEIINESRQTVRRDPNSQIPHTEYLIGTLAESVLNSSSQHINVKFLKTLVNSFKCIRDTFDIGSTLGEFIKHRIKSVLTFSVTPIQTDSDELRLSIAPGKLGLPDPSYYSTPTKSRVILAYGNLLKRLGNEFDTPGLEVIIGFEQQMASAIEDTRQDTETLLNGQTLKTQYPNIPWEPLIKSSLGWSSSKFSNHQILIVSTRYMKRLNSWFREIPIESWKLWFSSQMILHMLPLLPPPFDDWEFELFGKRLRGQTEKMPQHRLALHLSQQWLSASLGSTFIQRFVPPSIKIQALNITNEIKDAAMELISKTPWLEEKTCKIAARKVKSMYLGVAYPAVIDKDKKTELHPEQMLKNILLLSELDFQDEMSKINTKLHSEKWEDAVFAVNAYYYNEANRLILPAGILRWPFFHTAASDGWNFGGLGSTIGHEISHAFDNDGKDYDEQGNKNPWWSRAEEMRYHKKTVELIELYNKTLYFGKHLNGVLTLSENIADLCGVSIALSALKKRLKNKPPTVVKHEMCEFFKSFAVSWRTKEKKEKVIQSLFMDVHAPPPARVNNIVSQFDEWYECYDIKPGDELYRDPTERIRIF
jgi:predicted metalloendopeptidase